jgi:hypothetical protein
VICPAAFAVISISPSLRSARKKHSSMILRLGVVAESETLVENLQQAADRGRARSLSRRSESSTLVGNVRAVA